MNARSGFGRLGRGAFWITPSLFCLALYWYALNTWFQADDFAWLSLGLGVSTWRDLARAVFLPMAQGTIRPLSERAFFLVFHSLFGLDALAFHIWVFLTQFASLILLSSITWRVTGSRLAGWLAPILWTAASFLATVLSWASAYNEVLCAFFLLAAFRCLLWYIDTGRRRFAVLEWIFFLLGFGALEINVVYPALAAAWCLLCARGYARRTLPMFGVSAAFALVHSIAAPTRAAGPYALHYNAAVIATFAHYWGIAFAPSVRWKVAVLTALLLWFTASRALRDDRAPLFFLAWFVLAIAPVLPLRDHVSDYYLTIPAIGTAMLGAYAAARAFHGEIIWKAAAAAALAIYLSAMLPDTRNAAKWWFDRGRRIETLVLGAARARELHPDKTILLSGIGDDLFWPAIAQGCFRTVGVSNIYLTPDSTAHITPHPELGRVSDYVVPAGPALRGLAEQKIAVYAVGGPRLKNVTFAYEGLARAEWKPEEPRRVEIGNPLMAYLLGTGWYPAERGFRWMAKHATVRMGGPVTGGEKLYVSGYCAAVQCGAGPVYLTVTEEGLASPPAAVRKPDARFEAVFDLPPATVGRSEISIALDVDRTFRPPGQAGDLGLVFGTLEIR